MRPARGTPPRKRAPAVHRPHPPPDRDRSSSPALLVIAGPVAAGADVWALCEQLSAVMATCTSDTVVCDAHGLPPNARALEALARLQLTARRLDRRIRLRRASPALQQLIAFTGLGDVVPTA